MNVAIIITLVTMISTPIERTMTAWTRFSIGISIPPMLSEKMIMFPSLGIILESNHTITRLKITQSKK